RVLPLPSIERKKHSVNQRGKLAIGACIRRSGIDRLQNRGELNLSLSLAHIAHATKSSFSAMSVLPPLCDPTSVSFKQASLLKPFPHECVPPCVYRPISGDGARIAFCSFALFYPSRMVRILCVRH